MGRVHIMDHPLVRHKIDYIRRKEVGTKEFREMIEEIAMLMCYEATRELKLADVEIETPLCKMTGKELAGRKLAVSDQSGYRTAYKRPFSGDRKSVV